MDCKFCSKHFVNCQNRSRHEKICKVNPDFVNPRNTQNELLETTETLLREQINFLKEQLIQKEEQIKEKDSIIFSLIKTKDDQLKEKDIMICSLIEKMNCNIPQVREIIREPIKKVKPIIQESKESIQELPKEESTQEIQKEEEPIQESPKEEIIQSPKIKIKVKTSKHKNYIEEFCSEAYNIDDYIEILRNNFSLEEYIPITTFLYESKYMQLLKKMNIDKNKSPIQVKCSLPGKEEGYIKIEDKFINYVGSEFIEQLKKFVNKIFSDVFVPLRNQYSQTSEYIKMNNDRKSFADFSIMGIEEESEEHGKPEKKKKEILQKRLMDFFYINLENL